MIENPGRTPEAQPEGLVFTETISRAACPACGASGIRNAFSDVNRREGLPLKGTFVECLQCETLYLQNIPAPNALARAYATGLIDPVSEDLPPPNAESLGETPKLGFRHIQERTLRAVSRLVRGRPHSWPEEPGHGRRILDFGCATGAKLAEFQERGWEIAGIDLSEPAIARARATLPSGHWFAGPIEEAPASDPFDVIRTDNVVEHLPQPVEALALLRRRLKIGGCLFVYVPNGRSLSVRFLHGRSQASWMPFHLQLFSPCGLDLLLRRAGFEEVRLRQFTPLSWWELTARQILRPPGFLRQRPGQADHLAIWTARALTPFWLLAARLGHGEELVAEAR